MGLSPERIGLIRNYVNFLAFKQDPDLANVVVTELLDEIERLKSVADFEWGVKQAHIDANKELIDRARRLLEHAEEYRCAILNNDECQVGKALKIKTDITEVRELLGDD